MFKKQLHLSLCVKIMEPRMVIADWYVENTNINLFSPDLFVNSLNKKKGNKISERKSSVYDNIREVCVYILSYNHNNFILSVSINEALKSNYQHR